MGQQWLSVFPLRSAYCAPLPHSHWPCLFYRACCCVPALLSYPWASDIPGNLSSGFAVQKIWAVHLLVLRRKGEWNWIRPRVHLVWYLVSDSSRTCIAPPQTTLLVSKPLAAWGLPQLCVVLCVLLSLPWICPTPGVPTAWKSGSPASPWTHVLLAWVFLQQNFV